MTLIETTRVARSATLFVLEPRFGGLLVMLGKEEMVNPKSGNH
jgi:hypothetical protein